MERDRPIREKPTVLGIIASERRLGNCELVVKEISKRIDRDHDLAMVRLPALTIRPCKACYRCLDSGVCGIDDDVSFLVRQIASSDAVIIAAPVYFLGPHASIKSLLDRAFSFFGTLDRTAGKPCLLVSTYGMKDRIGTAPQALLTLASFLGMDVKASVALQAALPGEILTNRGHAQTAAKLAKLLFSTKSQKPSAHACPYCGNDIVRMRSNDFICTLCHGSFHLDQLGKVVPHRKGWDVKNRDFVPNHRQWLKGMKEKFFVRRKELLRATLPYKEMGRWIEPGTDE